MGAVRLAAHRTIVSAEAAARVDHVLIAVAAVAVLGFCAWLSKRPTLESVAGLADRRAGLHDELLSALWFAVHGHDEAGVARHVDAAGTRVQTLSLPALFPVRHSPAALAGVALCAAAAAGAVWWPAAPGRSGSEAMRDVRPALAGANEAERSRIAERGEDEVRDDRDDSLWEKVNRLARDVTDPGIARTLAEAVAARDARAAARALLAAGGSVGKDETASLIRAEDEGHMSDTLAKDILARLAEIQRDEKPDSARPPASGTEDRPTAQFDRALMADREDAQQSAHREQSAAEEVINTALHAMSRSSSGGRDSVHGEADSADGGGRAAVGGAMGRRIQSSAAGSGEGDSPDGVPTPVPEGDPVLGEKTRRLEAVLRAVEVKAEPGKDDPARHAGAGAEEDFFTATRAQAAMAATGAETQAASGRAESAQRPASFGTAAYREAAKRYTLARHRRDAAAGPGR